jgi:hypothetical protein
MRNSYVNRVPLTVGSGLFGPSSGHGLFWFNVIIDVDSL